MGASLAGAGLIGAGACLSGDAGTPAEAAPATGDIETLGPGPVSFTLRINDTDRKVTAEPRTTLLSVLRDQLDLTGTKEVCDRGACGGCTILIDGRPRISCMMLALDARGKAIRTIEGLTDPSRIASTGAYALGPVDGLDPVQRAFVEQDALMCGFCTPGLVMAVRGLLDRKPEPTPAEVRAATAGNICRCGTYTKVFEAALAAARTSAGVGRRRT